MFFSSVVCMFVSVKHQGIQVCESEEQAQGQEDKEENAEKDTVYKNDV